MLKDTLGHAEELWKHFRRQSKGPESALGLAGNTLAGSPRIGSVTPERGVHHYVQSHWQPLPVQTCGAVDLSYYCWSSASSALIDCCFVCLDCSLRQNRMKHSLILFLSIITSTSLFTRKEPSRFSYHDLDEDRDKKLVLPEEQLLVDTECQTANQPGWIGLPYRTGWVRYRVSRAGITESLKQQPLGTEHQASSWPCRLGLSPCPRWVCYRVSRTGVTEGQKQQPLSTALFWKVEVSLGVIEPMHTSRLQ